MSREFKERINTGPKVFISYSHSQHDERFVSKLSRDLQEAGLQVWIDSEQIFLGDDWDKTIKKGIRNSEGTIIVLTPESARSVWIKKELEESLKRKKQIFPLVLEGGEGPLEVLELSSLKTFDAREDYQKAINELVQVIQGSKS